VDRGLFAQRRERRMQIGTAMERVDVPARSERNGGRMLA